MVFSPKDDVFIIAHRDTGEIHKAGAQPKQYEVNEDSTARLSTHDEVALLSLPCKHAEQQKHFVIKANAFVKGGFRHLKLTVYRTGMGASPGGRYSMIQQKFPRRD